MASMPAKMLREWDSNWPARGRPADITQSVALDDERDPRHPEGVLASRRATSRALARWAESRRDRRVPTLCDLLSDGRECTGQEFLLKADSNPGLSVLVMHGDGLRPGRGGTALGLTLCDAIPMELRDELSEACAAAQLQEDAVGKEGAFTSASGTEVRYRSIFMPVRSDSGYDHKFIFGVFGKREYGEAEAAVA